MSGIRSRTERGASLVEFALVLPVLCLFLFGIIQFGIVFDRQQSINSAAREGARIGSLETATLRMITERAVSAYGTSGLAGGDPTVTVFFDDGSVAGSRCPDSSFSGSASCPGPGIDEDDEELMPCGSDPQSAFVGLSVSTPYDITIPFFGVQSVTVDSEAEFRCE